MKAVLADAAFWVANAGVLSGLLVLVFSKARALGSGLAAAGFWSATAGLLLYGQPAVAGLGAVVAVVWTFLWALDLARAVRS